MSTLARRTQRQRLDCWRSLRAEARERRGPLSPLHSPRNAAMGLVSKIQSKPPKLLSLIGPCSAKASNYPAFLRALGHSFPNAALDALSALPPKADMCGPLTHVRYRPVTDMRGTYCHHSRHNAPAVFFTAFESFAGTVSMTSKSCRPVRDRYRYFGGFPDARWNV